MHSIYILHSALGSTILHIYLCRHVLRTHAGSIHYSETDIVTDDFQLSDTDRSSYEKVFSSILVPYTALTIGEEIGHGA